MAKWRQMILAGIAAAGLSLFVGVRAEAAPENDSYVPGQVYAAEKPRIVDGDPVIYLDGGDKISVEGEGIESVAYTSDDAGVAKIDDKGSIKPFSAGKTKIHAAVTSVMDGERTTEALSYDLQVLPKSTEYFKYEGGRYGGKNRIVGLTAKGKQLQDVYIPGWRKGEEVLEVHVDTFKDDTVLQRVYVPDNLIYLDYQKWADDYWSGESFSGCTSLKELHLGKNLKGVGHGFAASLEKITVDERNETFQVQDNVLFAGKERLICYPGARKDEFYQIPEGVKTVEEDAFFGAKNLKKVGFPSGIQNIIRAFRHAGLTEAVIPESVEYDSGAFAYCSDLTKAVIETEKDEYSVFEGCKKLKSVSVKKAVSGRIFVGCKSVEEFCLEQDAKGVSVKDGVLFSEDGKELLIYPAGRKAAYQLPDGTEKIADYAFAEACTPKVRLNEGLEEIGEFAFYKAEITAMTLPDSVCRLGRSAFEDCRSLGSVKLSKNLETVPDFAFDHCVSLKKLHIPKKVKEVGVSGGCRKLTAFTVEKGNSSYAAQKGVLYSKSGKILYAYPPGKKGENYAVPGSVKKIWDSAFADNRYLQEITMGDQVTYCGDSAFSSAASLKKVSLSKELSVLGRYAFSGCKKLQSATVPDQVKRIELATFEGCTAIRQITLGRKVEYVDVWNFYGCKNLQKLTCRSLIECWDGGICIGGSFEQTGSKNYSKLIVSFPSCKSKNKRLLVEGMVRGSGLNKKSKVVFGKD